MIAVRRSGVGEWWGSVFALGLGSTSERLAREEETVVKLVAMGWVKGEAQRAVKQARIDGVALERLLRTAAMDNELPRPQPLDIF